MKVVVENFVEQRPNRPVKGKPTRTTRGNNFQAPGTTVPNMAARTLRFGIPTDEIKVTMTRKATPNSNRLEYKVLRSHSLENIQGMVIAAQWQGFAIESYGSEIV